MKSVLIADDDPIFRQVVGKFLSERGFNVTIASDGMQASMLAIRNSPDVVILDIRMPAGSGLEVLKRLRGSQRTSQTPVLAVSADANGNLPLEAKARGAAEFMLKPVDPDELYKKLCALLNISRADSKA